MRQPASRRFGQGGQVLVGVILVSLVLLIIIPALVTWLQSDVKLSVKNRKGTTAFHLAETAVERGYWYVKSSTGLWNAASGGAQLQGYHFDTTYNDVNGGTYRISISSVATKSVTIIGEGRDVSTNEKRAIKAVFQNQTVYSPLLASGNVTLTRGLVVFWGPIMSQGDLTMSDDDIANLYYPNKYAKGVVTGTNNNPRDTSGLNPPNSGGSGEWNSAYQFVPDLPILDFAALRSSASATSTLNVYGCKNSAPVGAWDARASCGSAAPHTFHFGDTADHPSSGVNVSTMNYVWYWDGDVTLSGNNGNSSGLRGMMIVRGNLTIDTPGQMVYTNNVPLNAWNQHQRGNITSVDTNGSGEYPADLGFQNSNTTFKFGTDTFCLYPGVCSVFSTPGMRGFTYVGGNLSIKNASMDFNGAVWVNGAVNSSGTGLTHACGVFYDDTLSLPTLNVILTRLSWQETPSSPLAWP